MVLVFLVVISAIQGYVDVRLVGFFNQSNQPA